MKFSRYEDSIKSTAMGVVLGAAVGAVGTYMIQQNPKQVKKAVKKVTKTAERAIGGIENMVGGK